MLPMDEPATQWYRSLEAGDLQRLDPILDLFSQCVPTASAGYYPKNILTLKVDGAVALALSPRKSYISFYVWSTQAIGIMKEALPRLGKVDPGVGCLRFRKLADINMDTLREVFTAMAQARHDAAYGFK